MFWLYFEEPPIGGQAAHEGRGAPDRGCSPEVRCKILSLCELALVPVAITARLHLLPGNVVIEQMLRYSLVAIVYPPMYASSFWTRYRNGLGPLFLSLTKPQIVSIELPSAFFLAARSIP